MRFPKGKQVIRLRDKRARKGELSGGKGAGLAQLLKFGCPVPAGFVITAPVFKTILAYNAISLSAYPMLSQSQRANLRESIGSAKLPARLYQDMVRAFAVLAKPVAVRSSMVGEDSTLASCAGQLDTFLDIHTCEHYIAAIKACYASILNDRLLVYMRQTRAAGAQREPEMAVVLQEMVPAEAAGVAFSSDPISGQRCTLIEAVRGSGKPLMDGTANPDRYRVDGRGVISEICLVEKNNPVLSESRITRLHHCATSLAGKLNMPVDVEWAFTGERLYLLQVRPITSLAGKHVYSNRLVADMTPGRIKPLLWSSNVQSMAVNVFGRLFTTLAGPRECDFALLNKRVHSRNYTDMTMMGELLERIGLPGNFLEMIARGETLSRPLIRLSPRMLWFFIKAAPFFMRYARATRELRSFVREHRQRLMRFKQSSWSGKGDEELYAGITELMKIHGLTQWYVVIAGINMMVRNRLFGRFLRKHAPDIAPQALMRGLVGVKSLEPNLKIQAMAASASRLGEDAIHTLLSGDAGAIERLLRASQPGKALLQMMGEFMRAYGFLSARGTDFSAVPWCEDPGFVWKSVARRARGSVQQDAAEIKRARDAAEKTVITRLHALNRVRFKRKLSALSDYIALREEISMLMSEDAYQMRRIILALADNLCRRKVIPAARDVFFLYIAEISALVRGVADTTRINDLIAQRKADYARDADLLPADTICGDRVTYKKTAICGEQRFLAGICGSPGQVTGRARVVFDPACAPEDMSQRDILIVPFADAGWTPLFTAIGGVVAETGGQLSHASIVAREYGLPAIVSAKHATTRIRDKQRITLNASQGKVYLH